MPSPELIDRFAAIVGTGNALTASADVEPYLTEGRGLYRGATPLVLRPGSTEEVAAILKLASETKTPIVPVSGGTGLVGGGVPRAEGQDIVLSLARLNRIRDVDPVANVIAVDGGVILADVHKAATEVDRLFPLSLGSEGSCRVAGNLSTNAGALPCSPMAICASFALGLRSCCRPAKSGTACGG